MALTLTLPEAGLTSGIVDSTLTALLIPPGAAFAVLLTVQCCALGRAISMASVTNTTDNDLRVAAGAVVETGGWGNNSTSV